ncbi:MAG: hypothetical protein WEC73_02215, partial [Chthoniobacterales bacterium]
PLRTELAAAGITLSEINPAKQAPTVQRWKLHVIFQDTPTPTRLEFSRRGEEEFKECRAEPPSASLLAEQQVVPFIFNRYNAKAAYRQKIHALAARTLVQARDVFDLHHLTPAAAAAKEVPREIINQAMKQLGLVTFEMFREQVIPFLPSDLAAHYGTPAAWRTMTEKVRTDLATTTQLSDS